MVLRDKLLVSNWDPCTVSVITDAHPGGREAVTGKFRVPSKPKGMDYGTRNKGMVCIPGVRIQ